MNRRRGAGLIGAALGVVLSAVVLVAQPAAAATGGWYSKAPFTPGSCSKGVVMAVGSDRGEMTVTTCLVKYSSDPSVAETVIFENHSYTSSAAVDAYLGMYNTSNNTEDKSNSCGAKTLKPRAQLYCVSYPAYLGSGKVYAWSSWAIYNNSGQIVKLGKQSSPTITV